MSDSNDKIARGVAAGRRQRGIASSANSPWLWLAVAGSVALTLIGVTLIVALTRETPEPTLRITDIALGTNCSIVQCTGLPGNPGPSGPTGGPGADGEKGEQGDQGDQGDQGQPGPSGPPAQCDNNNPACAQGATGPIGPTGPTGVRGATGPIGPSGPTGASGTQGATGPAGPSVTGASGPIGPEGIPGTCDCLALGAATFDTANVTNTLTIPSNATIDLQGTLNCLAPLPLSCFGLAVCPNFTACDLEAKSLTVADITLGGRGVEITDNSILFNSPAPFLSRIVFGDSSTSTNRLQDFFAYATTTRIDGRASLNLRALEGTAFLRAGGANSQNNVEIDSISGQVRVVGAIGTTVQANSGSVDLIAGNSQMSLSSSGTISAASASNVITTSSFLVRDTANSLNWFQTIQGNSYECPDILIPNRTLTLEPGGSHDFIGAGVDLVLSGTSLLKSTSADGLVRSVGFNFFCNAILKTEPSGLPLQLQEDATQVVDIRGVISNGVLGAPVKIIDLNGVDFEGTALFNSDGGGLVISDPVGLVVNQALSTNTIQSLAAGVDPLTITAVNTTIVGDLIVTGSITAGSGGCCTPSDSRIKQNVTLTSASSDLKAILKLPDRVSFRYTDGYLSKDSSVKQVQYEGFIAQELEKDFPQLVHTREMDTTLSNGEIVKHLKAVHYDRMVPYLVGAIKALQMEIEELKTRMDSVSKVEIQ